MSKELKPCPCCGNKDSVRLYNDYRQRQYYCSSYYIKCDECGIKTDWYETEKAVIKTWNKRHTPNKIESAYKKRWNILKNYPTKNGFESKLRFIMLDWMGIIENMPEDIL